MKTAWKDVAVAYCVAMIFFVFLCVVQYGRNALELTRLEETVASVPEGICSIKISPRIDPATIATFLEKHPEFEFAGHVGIDPRIERAYRN